MYTLRRPDGWRSSGTHEVGSYSCAIGSTLRLRMPSLRKWGIGGSLLFLVIFVALLSSAPALAAVGLFS